MRAPSANFCKVAPFFSCFGVFHGIGMIQAHVKPWVIIYHNHHIYHSPFVLAVWTLQVQRVRIAGTDQNPSEPIAFSTGEASELRKLSGELLRERRKLLAQLQQREQSCTELLSTLVSTEARSGKIWKDDL
jgi:hypothetical protein